MKDPKISFAICVHNEHEEIDLLLRQLTKYKKDTDEIVVQCDQGNTTSNVYKVLDKYKEQIRIIESVHYFLKENPEIEVFWVPRINTVDGITQEHIRKWGWIKDNKGRINFPDYQCRILQNTPKIKWTSKVHEVLIGHTSQTQLPANSEFCLIHPKTIDRQEHQNNFYNTI
jgi:hypothetical protein